MANDRMLGCQKCREEIWLGKETTPLFYKEKECLIALGDFLERHLEHPLTYFTLHLTSPNYTEIHWNK